MSAKIFLLAFILSSAQAQTDSPPEAMEPVTAEMMMPSMADLGLNKTALLASLAELTNKTVLVEKLRQFFDFENAGQTNLGKMMAWKGDLIQPVIMFALGLVIIYSTIELIIALFSGLLGFKATVIGRIFSLFQAVLTVVADGIRLIKNPILEKLNGLPMPEVDDMTPAAEMGRRALDKVSSAVMAALNKYN